MRYSPRRPAAAACARAVLSVVNRPTSVTSSTTFSAASAQMIRFFMEAPCGGKIRDPQSETRNKSEIPNSNDRNDRLWFGSFPLFGHSCLFRISDFLLLIQMRSLRVFEKPHQRHRPEQH